MIDQEQTTPTTETTSSDTSQTTDQSQAPDTSTTEQPSPADDESIDLGKPQDKPAETDEEKPDERTPEQVAADEARAELFGAPAEDQSYEITGLPEDVEIDQAALDAIAPTARELNLSSKGLSKLAATYTETILPHVAQTVVAGLERDAVAKRSDWETEARDAISGKVQLQNAAGQALGFDGKSITEVQKTAAKALDHLAPAGFREWLDETGLGVHPQMVAFAYHAGKTIAEDREIEPADTSRKAPAGGGRPMTDTSKFY